MGHRIIYWISMGGVRKLRQETVTGSIFWNSSKINRVQAEIPIALGGVVDRMASVEPDSSISGLQIGGNSLFNQGRIQ